MQRASYRLRMFPGVYVQIGRGRPKNPLSSRLEPDAKKGEDFDQQDRWLLYCSPLMMTD